jgi:hypothetical protein
VALEHFGDTGEDLVTLGERQETEATVAALSEDVRQDSVAGTWRRRSIR